MFVNQCPVSDGSRGISCFMVFENTLDDYGRSACASRSLARTFISTFP